MKLGEILNQKDFKHRILVTVRPKDNISTTIQKMAENDRGSLPVCDDKGALVGIITERDIVRKCFGGSADCAKVKVKEVMSQKVVIGSANDDIDYAIGVMKKERIRHIPIVEDQKLLGIISMRDLLGVQLEESRDNVKYLSDYISGGI